MTPLELIAIIASGLRVGASALEIARSLTAEHGGTALPTIEDLERYAADTQAMRDTPDLARKPRA